jgi:hypothetical protein
MRRKPESRIAAAEMAAGPAPADVAALARAYSFTPVGYTDFRQAWDLRQAMEERPLFRSLARLSGKICDRMIGAKTVQ